VKIYFSPGLLRNTYTYKNKKRLDCSKRFHFMEL